MNTKHRRDYHISKFKIRQGCRKCGYRSNSACLHFDHLDRSTKSPITKSGYKNNTINLHGSGGMYRLYQRKHPISLLIAEIRKCQILCSNCHGEKTYPKRQVA